jgi:prepilin-type N-terminal cleavage/methylation domain-containing protein
MVMKRGAFTMVELILVIVIFGIIASIGADIIARMYQNYVQARTINYLQAQSEITLQQIAKRLQYRIKTSAVAHRSNLLALSTLQLGNANVDESYDVIEWIGYSNEAMLDVGGNPGWSGFIDLAASSSAAGTLSTPGSNLDFANTVIDELTNGEVTLTNRRTALIFKGPPDDVAGIGTVQGFWGGGAGVPDYTTIVTRSNDETFNIVGGAPRSIYEQYHLAHTAYAIVPNLAIPDGSNTNFRLELRYNFQPWLAGGTYDSADTDRAVLADNVNLFRVQQIGSTIHLKLCLHDNERSGTGDFVVACKEEVVL